MEESKAKVDLYDELRVKSQNLECTNEHLALEVRHKDEAIVS